MSVDFTEPTGKRTDSLAATSPVWVLRLVPGSSAPGFYQLDPRCGRLAGVRGEPNRSEAALRALGTVRGTTQAPGPRSTRALSTWHGTTSSHGRLGPPSKKQPACSRLSVSSRHELDHSLGVGAGTPYHDRADVVVVDELA